MGDYRGFETSRRSVVGGTNVSRDGDYVDHVLGGEPEARALIDQIIEEEARTEPEILADAKDRQREGLGPDRGE